MWLKILKGIVVAAKATGLDKKVVGWVKRRLKKAEEKIVVQYNAICDVEDELGENTEGGSE